MLDVVRARVAHIYSTQDVRDAMYQLEQMRDDEAKAQGWAQAETMLHDWLNEHDKSQGVSAKP